MQKSVTYIERTTLTMDRGELKVYLQKAIAAEYALPTDKVSVVISVNSDTGDLKVTTTIEEITSPE